MLITKNTAIAGHSGSGKSTISSLLLRFYEVEKGGILIDNVDIRELDLKWWRQQIGFVSQEPTLFAGTIRDNIAYGHLEASDNEIREAASKANCGFIDSFPDGIYTYVGERGISLSGGQKQRYIV